MDTSIRVLVANRPRLLRELVTFDAFRAGRDQRGGRNR